MSRTVIATRLPLWLQPTVTLPPRRLYLTAVREQVQQDLERALAVGEDPAAGVGVRRHGHAELLALRPGQVDGFGEQVLEAHGLERERELAGLDPGDVEQLGDQLEQVVTRAQDLLDAVALLARELVELEQLCEAEDRVHRRA